MVGEGFVEVNPVESYYMLHPRPVVLLIVSCPSGRVNAMPASWVTPVNDDPPIVAVAVDEEHCTRECLDATGEATLNIPPADKAGIVYALGTISGREVDKVREYSLKLVEARKVKAPAWAEALGVLEARVRSRVEAEGVILYLLDVVAAYAREGAYTRWGWDTSRVQPLLHGAGRVFYTPGRRVWARKP